jgi:hypothetical protein
MEVASEVGIKYSKKNRAEKTPAPDPDQIDILKNESEETNEIQNP